MVYLLARNKTWSSEGALIIAIIFLAVYYIFMGILFAMISFVNDEGKPRIVIWVLIFLTTIVTICYGISEFKYLAKL